MPRFFFPVDYDDFHCELSRNHTKVVKVYVVTEDRSRVGEPAVAGGDMQPEVRTKRAQ